MKNRVLKCAATLALAGLCIAASAQRYRGVIDKSVAIVGNEMISLSDVESQVQAMRAQGLPANRCDILENMMQTKLLIAQARVDSLTVSADQVNAQLDQYMAEMMTRAGGEDELANYLGKPIYKLRQEWRTQIEEQTLAQQEQQEIARNIPDLTPFDVKQFLDTVDVAALPVVPIKYQRSQICIYPDR